MATERQRSSNSPRIIFGPGDKDLSDFARKEDTLPMLPIPDLDIAARLAAGLTTGNAPDFLSATDGADAVKIIELEAQPNPDEAISTAVALREKLYALESPPIHGRPHVPRTGDCSFVIIDLKSITPHFGDESLLKKVIAEVSTVLTAREYYVKADSKDDDLWIVGTAQRSEAAMLAIAMSLAKTMPEIKIYVGEGDVRHTVERDPNETLPFDMIAKNENGPDILTEWRHKGSPGICIESPLAAKIQDPTSRKSSHCHIEVEPIAGNPALVQLVELRHKTRRRIGGPERFIECRTEYDILKDAINPTNKKTKLTVLSGDPGIGKSSLLEQFPLLTVCALDESYKGIPGGNLVTVMDQLCEMLDSDIILKDEMHEIKADDESAHSFKEKTWSEKIDLAQKYPRKLADLIFEAIKKMAAIQGEEGVFALEDLHLSDRFSIKFLIDILLRYARETDGKALITKRPEERYASAELQRFEMLIERFFEKESITRIHHTGLDFTDNNVSHDFAYYSFPRDMRVGKEIGDWHIRLGKIAGRNPLIMNAFMDELKRIHKTDGAFEVTGNLIALKPGMLDRLEKMCPNGDLETVWRQRIERLEGTAKNVLICVAFGGGKLTDYQISKIAEEKVLTISAQELSTAVDQLVEEGYLIKSLEEEGEFSYKLEHELIKDFVIDSVDSTYTPLERYRVPAALYKIFKHDDRVEPDVLFSLTHQVAITGVAARFTPEQQNGFWNDYLTHAHRVMGKAETLNSHGKLYAIGTMLLATPMVAEAFRLLKEGGEVSEVLEKILVQAILKRAESGVHLGKTGEVEEALEVLKPIAISKPTLVDKDRLTRVEFAQAYIRADEAKGDIGKMKDLIDKRMESFSESERAIAKVKLAYRKNSARGVAEAQRIAIANTDLFQELNREYGENHEGMPHPDVSEMERLMSVQFPFQQIRTAIKKGENGQTLDEDILLDEAAIPAEQKGQLSALLERINSMLRIREDFPCAFNPHSEMSLLDVRAQIQAMLGQGDESIKEFGEAWHQADQMELNVLGARYAKMMADVKALMGLKSGNTTERRKNILAALKILNEEAEISLRPVDKADSYNMRVRIQRIRDVRMLCETYTEELNSAARDDITHRRIRRELQPHIQTAFDDFWPEGFRPIDASLQNLFAAREQKERDLEKADPNQKEAITNGINRIDNEIDELVYYAMGSLGTIIHMAQRLGIEIPAGISQSQFMSKTIIGRGIKMVAKKTDRGIGKEVRSKEESLGLSYEFAKAA